MTETDSPQSHAQPNQGRRRFWQGVFAGGAGATLLSLGLPALSHAGHRGGFFRRGSLDLDPEAMRERAEFATDWMLSKVGASDAQKEQVHAIVARTVNAMIPVRDQHLANRKAMLEILAAPAVDAGRLAELRGAELKLADQASQALLDGITDTANVLTPEQRQQLVQMAERHRHGPWHERSRFRQREQDPGPPARTS